MTRYMFSARLNPAAVAGILKEASDREEANRRMYAAVGANLEHLYFSPDTLESFAVFTTEDMSRVHAFLLAGAATGTVDTATVSLRRILTGPELAELARNTSSSLYRAPGT